MTLFSLASRRMSLDLLSFIDETLVCSVVMFLNLDSTTGQDHRLTCAPGAAYQPPLPTKNLVFANGRLSEYHAELEGRDVFYFAC